jgi:hypothetical protein
MQYRKRGFGGLPPERIWSDAFLPIQIYVAKYLICYASYYMRR